jgi:NAD(P)-dependent dehydrogenase (short-subunit alcohol dehydrogenase family)
MGVALVTGGAGGIGLATARRLHRDGLEVVVADVLDPPADLDATFVRCDLIDIDASIAALREAIPGQLQVLVNAAGIVERTNFGEYTLPEFERVYAVNMRAPMFLIQGLSDRFGEGSAIVNVASMEATDVVASTGRTTSIYASTKAALKNLTETLAAELGPRGIRVNAVAPGLIVTRLTTGIPSETRDWFNRLTPLGDGFGQPEDIADVIAFLASGDARFVTGVCVAVDGGLSLGLVRR